MTSGTFQPNRRITLFGAVLFIGSVIFPKLGSTQTMSLLAAPQATPVLVDNRKFAVVENGLSLGLPQKSGYVSVIDVETIELLFVLKIFDVSVDTSLPQRSDQPQPRITALELNEAETMIKVSVDGEARYGIDLPGLTVVDLE